MPDFKPTPNFTSPLPTLFTAPTPGGCRAEGSRSPAGDSGTSLACLTGHPGLVYVAQ